MPLPPFDPPTAQRSRIMAAIRGRDTSPELAVRRALHSAGFRFRLHRSDLPGKPDLVLPKHRTAVLVHGCYWHGHGCHRDHASGTNRAYWTAKISGNRARDEANQAKLSKLGWKPVVIWECELETGIKSLVKQLTGTRTSGCANAADEARAPR